MRKLHKKDLLNIVVCKLKGINKLHIFGVINILIDELLNEIKSGKTINIPNFGVFSLNRLKSKRIKSISTNNIKYTKEVNSLRFKLNKKLSKLLSELSIEELKIEKK